jgi:tetratricopeptide (TPR) repeat protein
MKKYIVLLVVVAICILPTIALCDKPEPMGACLNYSKARQYRLAADFCQEAAEKTGKPEAWFELGNALVNLGKIEAGEKAWFSAAKLSKKYADKIGNAYREQGFVSLNTGQTDRARAQFRRYLEYVPKDRQPILAQELLNIGLKLLGQGNLSQEKGYLTLASELNFSLRPTIYNAYISAGNKAPEETAVLYWGEAIPYSDTRDQNIGKRVFDIGMKFAKKPGAEVLTGKIRNILREYMGDAFVEKELPEVWKATIGTWDYSGKKGERTPYKTIEAQRCRFLFLSNNKMFSIVYSDGKIYKMWLPGDRERASKIEGNNLQWYIVFEADSTVHVEVKEWM